MTNQTSITGGELTDAPNDQYRKFFEKFKEIESLDVMEWKPVHILAYFCKKYKELYDTDYKFKFNSPSPGKCFEVFQVKKLASLLTSQPNLLRDYIDWIYLNKVVKAKRRITSISYMTNDAFINEYKFGVLLAGKKNLSVDRSKVMPDEYCRIFADAGLPIKTYGDLAFASQMSPLPDNVELALSKIESLGFDRGILTRII
jgi:hypothetical protein